MVYLWKKNQLRSFDLITLKDVLMIMNMWLCVWVNACKCGCLHRSEVSDYSGVGDGTTVRYPTLMLGISIPSVPEVILYQHKDPKTKSLGWGNGLFIKVLAM